MKTILIGRVGLLFCLLVGIIPSKAQAPGELLKNVWTKLGADQSSEKVPVRLRLHISDKPEVNAWTTPRTGDIYISQQMLILIGSSEGELAFILGHEIGHVAAHWTGLSTEAQKQQMKSDLSSFLSVLGLLFESEEDRRNRYSHVEENLADAIGLYMIKLAGYNPYDSAAFFGRLQMYSGTTPPLTRRWNRYISSHPFNEDRIENLRRVMGALQDAETQKAIARNHILAVGRLRVLFTAATTHTLMHRLGYPTTLVELGPGRDNLIDSALAAGLKDGYKFIYSPENTNRQGHVTGFTVYTTPVSYGRTGWRSFFLDETGIIRSTTEDRSPTANDSPVK